MNKLKLIPEVVANALHGSDFIVIADRDAYDYVYAVSDIANLHLISSNKSNGARLLRLFLNAYAEYESACCVLPDANLSDMHNMYEQWAKHKGIDYYTTNEYRAFERLLQTRYENIHIQQIYFERQLQGFNVFEIISSEYAIAHFCKANVSFRGIYEALLWHTGKILLDRGVQFYNFEQDLGIEPLRRAKAKCPHTFLKKFAIRSK
jgi:hypothetical protein